MTRRTKAYINAALERGRPRFHCRCPHCHCTLHVWEPGDTCIWCQDGEHGNPNVTTPAED